MAFPYSKILCPIDFDDNAARALDKAVEIARHFRAKIFLVHVVPLIVQFGEVPTPRELYEDQRREAKAGLNEIAHKQLGGVEHEAFIYTGDVVGCILEAITKFAPDLLVMATHGRTGLSHLLLGSVAEAIVRKATCPVLTIHGEHTAAVSPPTH